MLIRVSRRRVYPPDVEPHSRGPRPPHRSHERTENAPAAAELNIVLNLEKVDGGSSNVTSSVLARTIDRAGRDAFIAGVAGDARLALEGKIEKAYYDAQTSTAAPIQPGPASRVPRLGTGRSSSATACLRVPLVGGSSARMGPAGRRS
jgi:hypothetical protein